MLKLLKSNHAEVDKLARMVDDMLDATRIIAGALTIQRSTFDLSLLVVDVVEKFRPLLTNAGCAVHLDAQESVTGSWDRFRMEQVLSNLLTNAARYAAGKPIRVSVSRTDSNATLIVRDEGKGIPSDKLDRIFERFKRAADAGDTRGLGLGLYICRQIILAHHGTIRVESQPGQGSKFIVNLPM